MLHGTHLLSKTTAWTATARGLSKTGGYAIAASSSSQPTSHPQVVSSLLSRGGSLNKTSFTAPLFLSTPGKRFYAGVPVVQVGENGNVMQPPADQASYLKPRETYNDQASRNFAYFMVGTYSFVGAMAAKNLVTDYLVHFSASADVLAMAKVEVDMASVPEGKNVIIKWRGKPVFIRHRTADEIQEANATPLSELRHAETDAERTKNPEWLVMLGVCTHLGCVPIGEAGDYGGWFCPCHGSHYDISGRIRKGPAPLNLEVPPYDLNDAEGKIVIG